MDVRKPPKPKVRMSSKSPNTHSTSRSRDMNSNGQISKLKNSKFRLLNSKKMLSSRKHKRSAIDLTSVPVNGKTSRRNPSVQLYNTTFSVQKSSSPSDDLSKSPSQNRHHMTSNFNMFKTANIGNQNIPNQKYICKEKKKALIQSLNTLDMLPRRTIRYKRRKPQIVKSKLIPYEVGHKSKRSINELTQIDEFGSTMVKSQIEYLKKKKNGRSGSFLTDRQFQDVKHKLISLRAAKNKVSEKNRYRICTKIIESCYNSKVIDYSHSESKFPYLQNNI